MIPKDGLIEILFCDTDGMLTFKTDVPFGKYYVQEVKTDQHYVLSEEKYPVAFEYQGQDTVLVNIHVNDGNAIENEMILGKITGMKVDTEGNTLASAKIGLFRVDTEEFSEENAILMDISDEQGVFEFVDVPYGAWIIREIESLEGYVLNDALHYVSVTEDEELIKVEIINKAIIGSVRLTKVDAEYPENKLTGAVFELYQDTDKNKEFDNAMIINHSIHQNLSKFLLYFYPLLHYLTPFPYPP